MDDNVVDSLRIEIDGNSDKVTDSIEKLISTLEKIKNATSGSNKGLNAIQKNLNKIAEAVNNINSGSASKLQTLAEGLKGLNEVGNINTGKTADRIVDLGAAVDRLKDVDFSKLTELTNGLQALGRVKNVKVPHFDNTSDSTASIPTTPAAFDTANINDALSGVVHIKESLVEAKEQADSLHINVDTFVNAKSETDLLKMKLDEAKGKLTALLAAGNTDSTAVADLVSRIKSLQNEIGKASIKGSTFKTILQSLGKAATGVGSTFKKVANTSQNLFKKATDGARNLFTMFQKRALYRAINSIISAITTGFKEGTTNVYLYSKAMGGTLASSLDSISTSFLYLKNSIGAAATPLINMCAPAIEYVIDKCISLLNILNQVFTKLSGASTWTKAVKYPTTYAEAANTATDANNKLKNSILGIDEINSLTDNNSSDSSSMFEEQELSDDANSFTNFFKPFADAWENEGQKTFDAIKTAFEGINEFCSAVGDSFKTIWQDGTGEQTVDTIFRIFQNILECVGNLSSSLTEVWETNDSGTNTLQNIWNIFNDLLGIAEEFIEVTANCVASLDFAPLMTAFEGCTAALEPLVDLIGNTLLELYQTVLLPIASWTIENTAPASIDAITAALQTLQAFLQPFLAGFKQLWDALQPIVEWVKGTVIAVIDGVKSLFEKLAATFQEKGEKIKNIVSGIGDIFSAWWVEVEPILNSFKRVVGKVFGISENIIGNVVGSIIDILSGLIDFIAGGMTGDLKRVWNGIVDIVVGAWNAIGGTTKGIVNDLTDWILDGIEWMVNGVIGGLNLMIDALNSLSFDLPDWVPVIGGKTLGFNIENISEVSIPRLADGGMVNAGTVFVAGEAGAEVVANIGSRTGVMNTDEMRESVEQGVMNANAEQNALLREEISILRKLLDKDTNVTAYVGTGSLISGLERKNRRDGKTVIPVGV